MSTSAPLSVSPQNALELTVGLDTHSDRTSSRRGLAAITGLLLTGALVAVGAANTTSLLPQSVSFVAGTHLAGAFAGVGLNLHPAGTIATLGLFFVAYVAVVSLSAQLSPRAVLTAIAALTLLVLLAPPLVSTDVFSYQAYARMGALYGINPYTNGPYAIFHDPLFQYIDSKWVNIPSAYGPVFTVFSYVLAPLSVAASVFAYKSLAAFSCIALVALVWHCARLRGKDPVRAAALVGLNPLLIIYGVGGGHNDLLMLVAFVGGLYAILLSRERLGGGLAVLATGIKLTAGILLPFALAAGGPRRGRDRRDLVLGAGIAVATVTVVSLAVFGPGSVDMLQTINRSQSEGNWQTLPGFLAVGLGLSTIAHIVGYALAAAFVAITCRLLRRVWRGQMDWIDGAGWATLTMLIASSSLLPWYVGWLLPLAAVGHDRRLTKMALVVTGIVQGCQLVGYIPHVNALL